MANVAYGSASWQSAGAGDDMAPGESHGWFFPLTSGTEAISISAHPVVGAPLSRYLTIENVQVEGGPLEGGQIGRRVNFQVRNTGTNFIPGYFIGASFISEG